MTRTATVLSASLLSLAAAWGEEAPAPAPTPAPPADTAPATPAAATTPAAAAPAATAPETTPAPPVAEVIPPAPVKPSESAPPSDKPKGDDVVFVTPGRHKPSAAPAQKTFGFGLTLGAGYDSNILLENTDTPTATDAKGAAYSAEARAQVRLVDAPTGRLSLYGGAEIDDYPSESEAQLIRYGGGVSASTSIGGFDPGLVVGYNRFLIDHEAEASAFNVNAYVAKVWEYNVGVLGVGSQYVDYFNNEPISGTLYDVSYRHWFLLESGRVNRRVELGLRVGKNVTTDDDLAYTILTPSLGVVYRIGSNKTEFGTQDLAAKVSYEIRKYPDPSGGTAGSPTAEAEKQKNLAFNATYDFWLAPWLSLGAYLSYSKRDSNDDSADYNRTQVGGRLTATW